VQRSGVDQLIVLFEQALEAPPERRAEAVREMSGGDGAIEQELSSLLAAHDSAGDYFDSLERDLITPASAAVFGADATPGGTASLPEIQAALGTAYRIVRELAGGMSRVFLATETRLGREVVIKVLPGDLAAGTRAERFRREIQLAAQLQHPHIVPLLASDSAGSSLYYTMPFVAGESLRERVARDGALPVRDARDIWRDVLEALSYAHTRGVIHRDIKPGNILLSGRSALVTDFGIARAIEAAGDDASDTAPGLTIGTPAYMAPEQVSGDQNADHRVDIYAAGLVMYEMLASGPPFSGASSRELMLARLTQDPAPLTRADCPTGLAQLVVRCLAKEPDDRPQTAETLLAELDALSDSAAVTGAERRPWQLRGRSVVALGIAATLLLGVSLGTWLRREPRDNTSIAVPASGPSIAVLPVATISSDPRDTVLAAGLTEELITTLSRAGNLRVSPTVSVSVLRGRGLDVRQIADSLQVGHILEGALQKVGPRLRFQVRLVDPRDGSVPWNETYNREMDDIFAMQDDIARAVGRGVGARLNTEHNGRLATRRYTPSLAAWHQYVEGTFEPLRATVASRSQAAAYLNRAIALDSNFAAAYAALAQLTFIDNGNFRGNRAEAFNQSRALALKAVALDDSLAAGHSALGWVEQALRNWRAAETELKRAVELDPAAPRGFEGLARVYMYTGQSAEQLATAREGARVAPHSAAAARELALALSVNGRCPEAIDVLAEFRTLTPAVGVAGVVRGQCYAAMGMWQDAIAEFRWASDNSSAQTALAFLGYALARAGRPNETQRILDDLLTGRKYSHGAFGIATVYAGLQNYDEAFAWLAKAVDERTDRVYLMGPMFADLQRDPRFAEIRRRMRLP
jgi:eukaryotic-like serine/threonine-protein kinase